jgi:hypothetical protein
MDDPLGEGELEAGVLGAQVSQLGSHVAPVVGGEPSAFHDALLGLAKRLAFRHRLPWSLMSFLADAHQRGVLRQSGAVQPEPSSTAPATSSQVKHQRRHPLAFIEMKVPDHP